MTHAPRRPGTESVPGAAGTIPLYSRLSLFVATVAVLLGAAAVVASAPELWLFVAIFAGCAAGLHAASGAGRRAGKRVSRAGDTVTVGLRRLLPQALAWTALALLALVSWAWEAMAGEPLHRGIMGLCALICVAGLPDLLWASVARSRVVLGPDRLRVRSWSSDSVIEWRDVAEIEIDVLHGTAPVIRIVAAPGAQSLVTRRRRILFPLTPVAPAGTIFIPAVALDEPWLLAAGLRILHEEAGREQRAHRLRTMITGLLTGSVAVREVG